MFGFLRRHLHRHVRRNIHRPWMQWTIRAYEGITTFFHSLLWFTGFLFLTGHVAATVVQAGYHLSNVWSNADRIVAFDLGHMGWQELLALASIPAGLMAHLHIRISSGNLNVVRHSNVRRFLQHRTGRHSPPKRGYEATADCAI